MSKHANETMIDMEKAKLLLRDSLRSIDNDTCWIRESVEIIERSLEERGVDLNEGEAVLLSAIVNSTHLIVRKLEQCHESLRSI